MSFGVSQAVQYEIDKKADKFEIHNLQRDLSKSNNRIIDLENRLTNLEGRYNVAMDTIRSFVDIFLEMPDAPFDETQLWDIKNRLY